jgi:deazaflavin-dependent oxidoreductase (nitroreductase family)
MNFIDMNPMVIEHFRMGADIEGMPGMRDGLLLLTTRGRRTGRRRTAPMGKFQDGDTIYVVAGNGGKARNPDWYVNLLADPHITVELADETYEAVATPVAGADRDRLWELFKQQHPTLADYEASTDRTIPVVAIRRV